MARWSALASWYQLKLEGSAKLLAPVITIASGTYALVKARAVRELTGATWGLSETGASGPSGNRYGDAAGHACLAVAGPVERVHTMETGRSDRESNMWAFAEAALRLLETCLREASQPRP